MLLHCFFFVFFFCKGNSKPIFIEASTFSMETVKNVRQSYAFVPENSKEAYLVALLTSQDPKHQ